MSLPFNLQSAYLLVCEKILNEEDGVPSAIRIVDICYFSAYEEIPVERRLVRVGVLGVLKSAENDVTERTLEVKVDSPDGKEIPVVPPQKVKLDRRIPEAPGGHTLSLDLHIRARKPGTHIIKMLLDGEEVARASVTLLPQPVSEA